MRDLVETSVSPPRVIELFAGIGLVRMAVERAGFEVVYANDVEAFKARIYREHFADDPDHFDLRSIADVRGDDLPSADLLTASFPCTDFSLAGGRAGLAGTASGLFYEVTRLLEELGERAPGVVMFENVPSLASSHGGEDILAILRELGRLGYWCDLLVVNARHFVPQSRARLFIVGSKRRVESADDWAPSMIRPAWIGQLVADHPELRMQAMPLALPEQEASPTLDTVVERLEPGHPAWWDEARVGRFLASLQPLQRRRLEAWKAEGSPIWATAYRRTRAGVPVWEMRADKIAGCLRTARGGSSKQALVEVVGDAVRVRWLTAREYARLQGADEYNLGSSPESRLLFGFGDAVCVPVVAWIAESYLRPLLREKVSPVIAESPA